MKLYVITYSERGEDPYAREREHDIVAANEHIAIMSLQEISGPHCRV